MRIAAGCGMLLLLSRLGKVVSCNEQVVCSLSCALMGELWVNYG